MKNIIKEKVIFDTDIGSDIDDAFALAYLLNKKDCELLGITTCTGEAYKRAMLCQLLLDIANKSDIPIYSGENEPLNGVNHQPLCPQARVLSKHQPSKTDFSDKAVDFMRDSINRYPNEVVIVAVGPLTNLGKLLSEDKTLAKKIKMVVMMGGKVDTSENNVAMLDWNGLCDKRAAEIVYSLDSLKLVIFPCDVTYLLNHPASYLNDNLSGPYSKLINDMADIWFERFSGFSYHDPMAATYIFKPELVKTTVGRMQIAHDLEERLGLTIWNNQEDGNHQLVLKIDEDRFLEELYEVINGKGD